MKNYTTQLPDILLVSLYTISIVLFFSSFSSTASSSTILEEVLINGVPKKLKDNKLKLKAADNLSIYFLTIPDSLDYSYQLKGIDTAQIISSKPLINYTNLKEGKYEFHYQIVPVENKSRPEVIFIEAKKSFLQSWSFVPLLLLYLMLLFGGAGYFIMLSNFRNSEKLIDLRSDWTNKLHNDIGADLSSLSLRINTLKRRLGKINPQMQDSVEKTYSILTGIQKKLRFVFDLVDPKKSSLQVMLMEMEDFAKEHYALQNIELLFDNKLTNKEPYDMKIGRVNKLYLVMKEIINNAVKYSKATRAQIQIKQNKKGLLIQMEDNGIGFDSNATNNGNGLENLKAYSREGFMDIDFDTAEGQGTKVKIHVPKL